MRARSLVEITGRRGFAYAARRKSRNRPRAYGSGHLLVWRLCLACACGGALIATGPEIAHATNIYWYSGSNAGPGYLRGHDYANWNQFTLPSGDYCLGYYHYAAAPEMETTSSSANWSGWTGFAPPSPVQEYQVAGTGVKEGTVCQAAGSQWGEAIGGAGSEWCPVACGMYHYVSLSSQGGSYRPWAASFVNPSLVLSAEEYPREQMRSNMGWGFLCPLLEDQTTGWVLEYCFQEWRTKLLQINYPKWDEEHFQECTALGGHPVGLLATLFSSGAKRWSETRSGNTYVWASSQYEHLAGEEAGHGEHYEAAITAHNLIEAINATNASCHTNALSTNPANWALVGIEQGREAWGHEANVEMGGTSANLTARTEYEHYIVPMASSVTGSGRADAIADVDGGWYVAPSTGSVFGPSFSDWIEPFGTPASGSTITPMLCDVNGDGKDDAVVDVNGSWYVALSNGYSFEPYQLWIANFGDPTQGFELTPFCADVNGDGKADAVVDVGGSWYVALSNGSQFGPSYGDWIERFGTPSPGSSITPLMGDVNGDGKADAIVDVNGSWYVTLSNGSQFGPSYGDWIERFGTPSPGVSITPLISDVNGDGKADAIVDVNGSWYVAPSTGSVFGPSFSDWIERFGTPSPGSSITPLMGDVNRDGKADAIVDVNGSWYVTLSNGSQFGPSYGDWIERFGTP